MVAPEAMEAPGGREAKEGTTALSLATIGAGISCWVVV